LTQNHRDNDVWRMKASKLALFARLQGIVALIDIYDACCDRKYRGKFVSDTFSHRLYSGTKYFLSTLNYTLDRFSSKFTIWLSRHIYVI